jgi:hypothetical protein
MSDRSADAVDRFKKALDATDARLFLDWLAGQPPIDDALRTEMAAFVDGERARLVKLRSLGLTQGTADRLALVEAIRDALRNPPRR